MMKAYVYLLFLVFVSTVPLLAYVQDDNPNWGYENSGTDWLGKCQTGRRQSPINIETSKIKPCSNPNNVSIIFLNQTVNTTLVYRDNTLRESITDKVGFLYAPDNNNVFQNYFLTNIHFHTFGEHQINWTPSILEMHMVFKARSPSPFTNDSFAVLGVRFAKRSPNSQKDPRVLNIIKIMNPLNYHVDLHIQLDDLYIGILNKPGQTFYHYKGSLTTPPCSELVNWYVMEEVLEMDPEDYQRFFDHFYDPLFSQGNGNFRKVQDINGREVCSMSVPL